LQQVLGGRAVVDEADQEVKNGGREFLVERLERLRIALPDAFPQRRFGDSYRHSSTPTGDETTRRHRGNEEQAALHRRAASATFSSPPPEPEPAARV
jgi:hypothetical protein